MPPACLAVPCLTLWAVPPVPGLTLWADLTPPSSAMLVLMLMSEELLPPLHAAASSSLQHQGHERPAQVTLQDPPKPLFLWDGH